MNIQLSTLFCICIGLAIPLLVLSTSRHQENEYIKDDIDNDIDRFSKLNYQRQPIHSIINDHYFIKRGVDFEQILRPCNQMPASGRGHEYSDCVRSRMLLMGKRKRRETS
ncbi:unnamed protein product [Adineta steineri]|uniref:Uncharacterized protein n=1 Tax=Adineta steineri TaxID=433720 RepID=A0A813STM6_9BILA|nr:unnamed protein product [Adineta steineri]CAF1070265.1 unnamed protein product [Adineta steineri]CAF1151149.1 unnamed protein product [Adineta steineri]CAF1187600.1 unnamed protein product [Adineta steineri]CAF1204398.1 unnamed protein product [Adineta steineri]